MQYHRAPFWAKIKGVFLKTGYTVANYCQEIPCKLFIMIGHLFYITTVAASDKEC